MGRLGPDYGESVVFNDALFHIGNIVEYELPVFSNYEEEEFTSISAFEKYLKGKITMKKATGEKDDGDNDVDMKEDKKDNEVEGKAKITHKLKKINGYCMQVADDSTAHGFDFAMNKAQAYTS